MELSNNSPSKITSQPYQGRSPASQKFEIMSQIFLSKFPETIPSEITHVPNVGTINLQIPLGEPDDITPHLPSTIEFISSAI